MNEITNIKDLKPGFYWARRWDFAWEPVHVGIDGGMVHLTSIGDDEDEGLPIPGLELIGPLTPPSKNWPEF